MKKKEIKEILKPIVKECIQECIHEALFESGIVTKVVAEVIRGVDIPQLVESMAPRAVSKSVPAPVDLRETKNSMSSVAAPDREIQEEARRRREEHAREMEETQRRLQEQMSERLGLNVFENVTPAPPALGENQAPGPLSGTDPRDPGINLSAIPGLTTLNFKEHLKG